jgi:hypothetical protein
MSTIWAFLNDPANREVLGWIGGGLVVVCGGLWTVITFFRKPAAVRASGGGTHIVTNGLSGWPLVMLVAALAGALVLVATLSGPRTTATGGGIAIGGDVRDSEFRAGNGQ